jgi:hypothetical protein
MLCAGRFALCVRAGGEQCNAETGEAGENVATIEPIRGHECLPRVVAPV